MTFSAGTIDASEHSAYVNNAPMFLEYNGLRSYVDVSGAVAPKWSAHGASGGWQSSTALPISGSIGNLFDGRMSSTNNAYITGRHFHIQV